MVKTNMNRRDWFRLRSTLSGVPAATGNGSKLGHEPVAAAPGNLPGVDSQSSSLTDVAHPPNHDGMDMTQLPPMREASLESAQVEELFGDLAHFAIDLQLMQRSAASESRATTPTVPAPDQLRLAKAALLAGDLARVQIRYRWDSDYWIDTLTRKGDVFHLIRICHR